MEKKHSLRKAQSHHPRSYRDYRYIYPVISRRSGGVSLGVNLNLDKKCNFDCPYCQVDRTHLPPRQGVDPDEIGQELDHFLSTSLVDGVCRLAPFEGIADSHKILKDVAISGDGEPTMVPNFSAVCQIIAKIQATHAGPPFKLVLITNSTLLNRPTVLHGIGHLLHKNGEVWAKLDAGSEEWYQKVNVSRTRLDQIENNLVILGKKHPFLIQSFFCGIKGHPPSEVELDLYIKRLARIRNSGADIRQIQLYTLARQPSQAYCTPVDTNFLECLKEKIGLATGIPAKVYGSSS